MRGTPSTLPCPWDPDLPETTSSAVATSAKAPSRYLLVLSPPSSPGSGVPRCGAGTGGGGPGQGSWPGRRRSPSTSSSLPVQLPSSLRGPEEGHGGRQGGPAPQHRQRGPPGRSLQGPHLPWWRQGWVLAQPRLQAPARRHPACRALRSRPGQPRARAPNAPPGPAGTAPGRHASPRGQQGPGAHPSPRAYPQPAALGARGLAGKGGCGEAEGGREPRPGGDTGPAPAPRLPPACDGVLGAFLLLQLLILSPGGG